MFQVLLSAFIQVNLPGATHLKKTSSTFPWSCQLSIAPHLGVRASEPSYAVLEWDLTWSCITGAVQFHSYHGQKILFYSGPLWPLALPDFLPSSSMMPEGWGCGIDSHLCLGTPLSALWAVLSFCMNCHPLHKEIFLMRSESCSECRRLKFRVQFDTMPI